jgi:hypothetical protein
MDAARRRFLGALGGTGAVLLLVSCGADDDGGGDAPATCTGTPTATIAQNHGHVMAVAVADLTAGATRTYMIRGGAMHDHAVTLSAQDFARLMAGETVVKQSSETVEHTHDVTVRCA